MFLDTYLVILLLYLAECVLRVPRDRTVVLSFPGSRCTVRQPIELLGTDRFRLVVCHPVPLFSQVFFTSSFSLYRANSAGRLRQKIRDSLDSAAADQRLEEYRKISFPLRVLCNILFLFLFVVAPLGLWRYESDSVWVLVISITLALSVLISWSFHRARQALYPDSLNPLWSRLLLIALWPMEAIRANDQLTTHLVGSFHPLVVTWRLGSEEDFRIFLRQQLLGSAASAEAACVRRTGEKPGESGHEVLVRQEIDRFLSENGMDRSELLRPPGPNGSDSRSYCPCCLTQFRCREGSCLDCGLALEAL